MRKTPQYQTLKCREDDWQEYSACSQSCRAEPRVGPRPQTQDTRSRGRSDPSLGHLKTMNLEGSRVLSLQIKHKDGILLKDVEIIRKRWIWLFYTLLNVTSSDLDPNIPEGLDQRPENRYLGIHPMMQELTGVI